MVDLIDHLKSFNRNEPFYVLTYALGWLHDCKEPTLQLGKLFRKELECKFPVKIPQDNVFVATEYHLNWIHASLYLASCKGAMPDNIRDANSLIENNQQDVDLLIAFQAGDKYHLIFVEGKGYSTTTRGHENFGKKENGELKIINKFRRLKQIVEYHKGRLPVAIEPYFCLISGDESKEHTKRILTCIEKSLDISAKWVELPLPKDKLVVGRVNPYPIKPICASSGC